MVIDAERLSGFVPFHLLTAMLYPLPMFSVICTSEAAALTAAVIGPGLPERCAPLSSATSEKSMRPR